MRSIATHNIWYVIYSAKHDNSDIEFHTVLTINQRYSLKENPLHNLLFPWKWFLLQVVGFIRSLSEEGKKKISLTTNSDKE